jgi:ribonuclease HI
MVSLAKKKKKGKMVLSYNHGSARVAKHTEKRQRADVKWVAPSEGMAKLNTDGSFVNSDEAGAGMVLRDHHGTVIVAAARQLTNCTDALDAELAAIEEGLALALHWTSMNLTVETDCAEAVELIKQTTPNMTIYASRIQEIREMLREREIRMPKCIVKQTLLVQN